jgi:hypothetical protein
MTIRNQFRRFTLPFALFLLFWLIGITVFAIIEVDNTAKNVLLISMCINDSTSSFYNFYKFLWPLLFELLILTFVLTTLQEIYGYNPVVRSRRQATNRRHHSVVLGYNHLGQRIVDYLREHKQHYSVVEIDYDKVEDLIHFGQPVVVGDYTDIEVMKLSGIKRCKEVFCVTTDIRRALIAAEKVRELNPTCDLYMRVFNEHFRKYLTGEPWNAYTFSISKWALESVKTWGKDLSKDDAIIVLGNDTVVTRIAEYFGDNLGVQVHLIDPEIEPAVYDDFPNVCPHKDNIQFIENLEVKYDLNSISQIYICWNTKDQFSDAILLTVAIRQQYPEIELFVRMFDEELADIAKTIDAKTFSTSAHAFDMLQKEVRSNSGIYNRK